MAIDMVPRLADALLVRTWTGIEGCMPDGLPVMGPSPSTPAALPCFRLFRSRLPAGPGRGAVLAELALDGTTPTPIDGLDHIEVPADTQPAKARPHGLDVQSGRRNARTKQ